MLFSNCVPNCEAIFMILYEIAKWILPVCIYKFSFGIPFTNILAPSLLGSWALDSLPSLCENFFFDYDLEWNLVQLIRSGPRKRSKSYVHWNETYACAHKTMYYTHARYIGTGGRRRDRGS
jgi:hypothetical protein